MGSVIEECCVGSEYSSLASIAEFYLYGVCGVEVRGPCREETVQSIETIKDHKGNGEPDRRRRRIIRNKAMESPDPVRPKAKKRPSVRKLYCDYSLANYSNPMTTLVDNELKLWY